MHSKTHTTFESRFMGLACVLLATCSLSLADTVNVIPLTDSTVLAVTDYARFPRNEATLFLGGEYNNVVAVSWTQTATEQNVTVAASIETTNSSFTTGTAYLVNSIGAGTTSANQVVAPVNFTVPAPPANNGSPLPLTVLFTGLNLQPGTYYLVLTAPNGTPLPNNGSPMSWQVPTSPQDFTDSSTTLGNTYLANGSNVSAYAPASTFAIDSKDRVIFDVFRGGAQVIELGGDGSTRGNWPTFYGAGGYVIPDDASTPLNHASVALNQGFLYEWSGATTDPRALLQGPGATTGIASAFTNYAGKSITINLNIYDNKPHTVGFYLLDWDTNNTRKETFTISDASTGVVYESGSYVSLFTNGFYAMFLLKGNLQIQITPNSGPSAVVSGIFID